MQAGPQPRAGYAPPAHCSRRLSPNPELADLGRRPLMINMRAPTRGPKRPGRVHRTGLPHHLLKPDRDTAGERRAPRPPVATVPRAHPQGSAFSTARKQKVRPRLLTSPRGLALPPGITPEAPRAAPEDRARLRSAAGPPAGLPFVEPLSTPGTAYTDADWRARSAVGWACRRRRAGGAVLGACPCSPVGRRVDPCLEEVGGRGGQRATGGPAGSLRARLQGGSCA